MLSPAGGALAAANAAPAATMNQNRRNEFGMAGYPAAESSGSEFVADHRPGGSLV